MTDSREIVVVYDGECPFCRNYCKFLKLKKAVGTIKLIDARESSAIMDEVTTLNLNIDQGMVVKFDDQIYFGSDAIHVLSLLSSDSDLFNRFNFMMFKSKKVSSILYPFLRSCRNLSLWLLNVKKIDNLKNVEGAES